LLLPHISEKQNVTVVQTISNGSTARNQFLLSPDEETETMRRHAENKQRLRVPRRYVFTASYIPIPKRLDILVKTSMEKFHDC
jgi:hypothetical protein